MLLFPRARLTGVFLVVMAGGSLGAVGQEGVTRPASAVAVQDPERLKLPYDRYTTVDRFGRTVTFYVGKRPVGEKAAGAGAVGKKLPLAVFVQGSGCESNFVKRGENIAQTNGHSLARGAFGGKVVFLVVEKPGVKYLDETKTPGSAEGASEEFKREHTLERWAEAVGAAVRAARTLRGVDGTRTLVMGHSEGGLVACKVAADDPAVTHVASLAGGGASQLVDLVELARAGSMGPTIEDPEKRVAWVLEGWKEVMEDPTSTTKMWLGHPYLRWSTFCGSSPLEELKRAKAKVFLGQGSNDRAVWPASMDVVWLSLAGIGRDVTAREYAGADHGFGREGDGPGDGMKRVFGDVAGWYLGEAGGTTRP